MTHAWVEMMFLAVVRTSLSTKLPPTAIGALSHVDRRMHARRRGQKGDDGAAKW